MYKTFSFYQKYGSYVQMDINNIKCPKFAWIITISLGCIDLTRGFIHTVMLEYAANNIFVIDLSGGVNNQMYLLYPQDD